MSVDSIVVVSVVVAVSLFPIAYLPNEHERVNEAHPDKRVFEYWKLRHVFFCFGGLCEFKSGVCVCVLVFMFELVDVWRIELWCLGSTQYKDILKYQKPENPKIN